MGSTYQLQKKYVDSGDAAYKTITKPVEGTVSIYANGAVLTGYTIDYTTGLVTGVPDVSRLTDQCPQQRIDTRNTDTSHLVISWLSTESAVVAACNIAKDARVQ